MDYNKNNDTIYDSIYLDNVIERMNENFNYVIEYENKQKESILYYIFDKIFATYQKNIYKYKLDKPVRIDDFLRLHHFKKIYSAKYNIKSPNNFEEELNVYNYREKIYIRWTDIIKHDSEDQRFQLYEKWKQKNIEKIQYMGELCLFFLDLFMSGKVYYNLGEILDDIEPNRAKELFHFLVERDNKFNK